MIEASLTTGGLDRLRHGALVYQAPAAIFSIAGPGAVPCLQGLLTNDLVKPGDGSLVYGALLTPKGLIILDCWTIRLGDRILLITGIEARTTALELFRKQLPPRLARVTDLTDAWQVSWLLGGDAIPAWTRAELGDLPAPGRALALPIDAEAIAVAHAPAAAFFTALIAAPSVCGGHLLKALALAGARGATIDEWEAARILAGWPRSGAEIDEKTLVQEVRFDENGGVSYDKGCYTGQETVARLHFRGHTNRDLRGLVWAGDAQAAVADARVLLGEKEVGSVRSILSLPTGRIGLALIRREVETGQVVTAGGTPATVVALPFPA
jgi:tRNA-modifying protein YgfZ